MNYKYRRQAVIVDVLDEREQQIKLRDANHKSNGALFAYLRRQKKEREELAKEKRKDWDARKAAIKFRIYGK